jgi:predicted molibdopterin-dependent oxidoreductase YjgC
MPIRGHSGVQGGAEMGAYATALPGGLTVDAEHAADLAARYGFPIGDRPGMTAEEMVEAGGRGDLDVLYSSGGNFLEVLPDPAEVEGQLSRVPLRVHQDVVLSTQMFAEPGEVVVLLPAATRYEQQGGGTETTTERRIAYSPEIEGPRPGEVRSEWQIFVDLARRVAPDRASQFAYASGQEIRDEIAQVVPAYSGIEALRETGDAIQWGGTRLCEGGVFPTADGRARFLAVAPSEIDVPPGSFVLSTRRGKQFNTMVHQQKDPLTGATRDALFMAPADIDALGLDDGAPVVVRSTHGEMSAHLHSSPLLPGNVQVFFPEGNVLLRAGRRDPASGVPDYNAVVTVEAAPR